jgi:(S)-ureidoglycine aminohydrolase
MEKKGLLLSILITGLVSFMPEKKIASGIYEWHSLKVETRTTGEMRLFMSGITTYCSDFVIHATTLNPGTAPHGSHIHTDLEEIILVKEGNVKITVNGKSKTLGKGSAAFILPGDEHELFNASDTERATYYIIRYRMNKPVNTEQGKLAGGSQLTDWNDLVFKPHNRGGVRKYFDRKTTLSDRIEMHATTLNPGITSHSPHIHGPEEIIIMMEGTTEMEIGDHKYQGKPGDIYFSGNDKPHGIRNTGDKPCMYLAFQWE